MAGFASESNVSCHKDVSKGLRGQGLLGVEEANV